MTGTSEATIHELAGRLTEAQKRALLSLPDDGTPRGPVKGSEVSFYCMKEIIRGDPAKEVSTIARLCKEVGRSGSDRNSIWGRTLWAATPLGLAVRAHLKEQDNG